MYDAVYSEQDCEELTHEAPRARQANGQVSQAAGSQGNSATRKQIKALDQIPESRKNTKLED